MKINIEKLIKVVLLLLLIFCPQPSDSVSNPSNSSSTVKSLKPAHRIIGGKACSTKLFPYMVGIASRSNEKFYHRCGGTLLNRRWVLTAAHCIKDNWKNMHAICGLSGESMVEIVPMLYGFRHPNFNTRLLTHDIGLYYLQNDIVYYTQYAALPRNIITEDLQTICPLGLVMGWGRISTTNKVYPKELQCILIETISSNICRAVYDNLIPVQNILCTLYKYSPKDSCQGDSGGPLLCNNQTQLGIISFGQGCAEPFHPGVNLRVDHYLDFIHTTLKMDNFERADWMQNSSNNQS